MLPAGHRPVGTGHGLVGPIHTATYFTSSEETHLCDYYANKTIAMAVTDREMVLVPFCIKKITSILLLRDC